MQHKIVFIAETFKNIFEAVYYRNTAIFVENKHIFTKQQKKKGQHYLFILNLTKNIKIGQNY